MVCFVEDVNYLEDIWLFLLMKGELFFFPLFVEKQYEKCKIKLVKSY